MKVRSYSAFYTSQIRELNNREPFIYHQMTRFFQWKNNNLKDLWIRAWHHVPDPWVTGSDWRSTTWATKKLFKPFLDPLFLLGLDFFLGGQTTSAETIVAAVVGGEVRDGALDPANHVLEVLHGCNEDVESGQKKSQTKASQISAL